MADSLEYKGACGHANMPCTRCGIIILAFRWSKAPLCFSCVMRDKKQALLEQKYAHD